MADRATADQVTGTPSRRPVALAVAAALVVVAAFVGVLVLGVVPAPAFPALAENPDPRIPGTVAYWDAEDSACLYVVDARGGVSRRLRCDRLTYATDMAWTADGNIVYERYVDQGEVELTIDVRNGQVIAERIIPAERPVPGEVVTDRSPDPSLGPDGTRAVTDSGDGQASLRLVSPEGQPRTLLDVAGPRDYAFAAPQWSRDGRWLLVGDSEQRLLIVDAGTGDTRLLATNATLSAWSEAQDSEAPISP